MSSSPRLFHRCRPHVAMLLTLGGCSGTEVGYPRVSDGVDCPDVLAPSPTAGAGAAAMPTTSAAGTSGASSASGGGSPVSGGTAAVAAGAGGGAGVTASGGAPATAPFTWPTPFDPSGTPTPSDGHHNPGSGCMSSACHGTKVPFLFGGTVYRADGVTGAPNVEVGITDGARTVTAYSASNGNLWLPSSVGAIDFANARIAIRSINGEHVKPATAGKGAACNGGGCHGSTMRLLAP